ncbi:unnamed protein product [Mytilus coruscus]|uniref:Ig-like domain-containing protein n=1 Tax=Mytilus coruscus TaxID=42192 RepID=A0A6J8EGP5_MYTCO|nr:unnamed protein product [Mytilus coruscus]
MDVLRYDSFVFSKTVLVYVNVKPVILEILDINISEGSNLTITPTINANPDPISVWWTRQNEPEFIYYGTNLTIRSIQRESSDSYTCHVMNTVTVQGHPTQNRTSEEKFNVNVQFLQRQDSFNNTAIGVGTGIAVVILIIGVTILNLFVYRKRQMSKTTEQSNSEVYETEIHEPSLLLTTSSDRATTGNEFNFTCNLGKDANGIISIVRDHTDECIIDVDRSCRLQNCNPNFVYSCNRSTICLTIPVKFDIDSLHGSRWKCHDILRDINSNEVLLYVNVPITQVNLTTIPYDINPTTIISGSRQSFKCTTDAVSPRDESIIGAAIGVGTGFADLVFISGVTSLLVFMNKKHRMFRRRVPITKVGLTATPYDKSPVEILAGSSQHFTCTTNPGRPPSKIQWYLSGANITNAATAQPDACHPGCNEKVISSSVLQYIGNINDNGKAIYCTAENVDEQSNRTTEKLFKVNVLYPPSVYMEPMYSPFIVQEDQQNIRLSCVVARANPKDAIMYQWTYPAGTVRDGDLTITTVSKSHYGLYSCSASNFVGTSTSTTKQIDVH